MKLTMKDVQRIFSSTDFSRGMLYYKQNRVMGMRETTDAKGSRVDCTVRGSSLYSVMFRDMGDGNFAIRCTCPRFADTGRCKHLAAAMISYAMNPTAAPPDETDRQVKALLERYARRGNQSVPPQEPARLVPEIRRGYLGENQYPAISLRVGREKLYVVKQIEGFLENVRDRKTVALGKQLTLDHSPEQFDDRSQKLIRLLMNAYPQFRSLYSGHRFGYQPTMNSKSEITINGDDFDRFFDLYAGESLESSYGKLLLAAENPKITVALQPDGQCARLDIQTEETLHLFGNGRSLYALGERKLYRCDEGFLERVAPLLGLENDRMRLSLKDMPTFCGCVLPEIRDLVTVEDPNGLLEKYLPEECTPCFYFDIEDDDLLLELKFRYGEREYPEVKTPGENIRRDIRREMQAKAFAGRYFSPILDSYVLTGEEEIYNFLTSELEKFREQGEVYVSDRLRRKQIPTAVSNVGISVSDGMLTLEMDTGEFPVQELEALYQSLLKKKKYHRLADGRFLTLDGSGYETLAEMSHMLQLTPRALARGTVQVPAFRALYLDNVLSGSEELNVTRDRQFRSMIRNFKSLSESDYTVPEGMENTLRPYQKLGFQWLKTLESCGFGGILADEMGLGKTLQVIAYLSTVDMAQTGHPSMVVCPASLILNWGEEFQKFAPDMKVNLIYGTAAERKRRLSEGGDAAVWVTSYELLRQDIEAYQQRTFYACILDEGQHIKNQSTLVSRAVKAINCRQRFVLTGTPIENRLSELWNLFDFLMPGYLYSHNAFVEKLEKPIVKSKNEEAMVQLRRMVQPFLLRRLKADVLKELPPKIEHIRRIPMGNTERKTYVSAVNAAKGSLEDTGKLKILAALTQLRQVCCDPSLCFENYSGETSKLEACLELCSGMVANGHQILLFSQFTSMLDILRQRLDKLGISNFTLQGSTSKEQRAKLVKQFNAGGASVFLISLKAGGTGLNLTAADVVIHYDPWWNLAAQNQATDRAHRIGQRQCVQVYKLIAKDTIEERILDLQDKKAELLDIISGEGGNILEMSKEELLALLD